MKVTVAEIRKLRDLVVASANNPKMRGETIVRAFAMANEICKKDSADGDTGYALSLFSNLNASAKYVERVIDKNKAKRNGKALVYIATKPGAFIAVDEAYAKMCLCDFGGQFGDGVNYVCVRSAISQLIGVTLLSPKRDFEIALDYIMKRASDEAWQDIAPIGYRHEAISEALKLRRALEKEYKLDGSLCHAAKMGFYESPETNREYLMSIANERDSSQLSNAGSVSILATVLLAGTMVYLRTVSHTAEGFYHHAFSLYDTADSAAIQEHHSWDRTVYTHMNILNNRGAIAIPLRLYVDSLRTRLNESIKAFLADTNEDTFTRLLTSICSIQRDRGMFMKYMDFTNGREDSGDNSKLREIDYLAETYWNAVRLTVISPNDKPEFELFR